MKKTLVILLTTLAIAGLTTSSFAQGPAKHHAAKNESSNVSRGTITAIDASAGTITVQAPKSDKTQTLTVSPKTLATLKVGDRVRYELKAGTTAVESLKVLGAKKKK